MTEKSTLLNKKSMTKQTLNNCLLYTSDAADE